MPGRANTAAANITVRRRIPITPALAPEIPPVGAVVSSEVQKERRPTDSLPPYVAFNTLYNLAGLLGPGFLPATYAPFHINTRADLSSFAPPADERETFQRRWELLKRFDSRLRTDSGLEAKTYRDFHNFYEGAVSLMSDQRNAEVFQLDADDRKRYGSSVTGDAFLLSRKPGSRRRGHPFHLSLARRLGPPHENLQ